MKRGGGVDETAFNEMFIVAGQPRGDPLALDEALTALAAFDPRKGEVVELRFFGGLTVEETAVVLKVSP